MTDWQTEEVRLTGMQRAEFAKAARLLLMIGIVQCFIAVSAAGAAYTANERVAYAISVLSLALAVLWGVLTLQYRACRQRAERARRASLIVEGLGLKLRPNERLQRETDFSVSAVSGKVHEDPSYYASREAVGPQRLAEMLEESAFWSSQLMERSKRYTGAVCAILAAATFFAILGLAPLGVPAALTAIRAVAAAFSVVVVADLFGAWLSFISAQAALERLMLRLDAITDRSNLSPELVGLLVEYNSTVESAPMFSPRVYDMHRERINSLWAERQARISLRDPAH